MSVQVIPGDCKIFNCMRNKLLFLPFFLLLVPGPSMARESIPRDTVGVKVYFRQNHASLDSLFRDNGSRLDSFSRRLSSFRGDTALQIRSVRVVSGASPEGSSEINRSLSERRSAAIRSYLEKRGSLEGYAFDVESRGVNWEELAAIGILKDELEMSGELDTLLRGEKTKVMPLSLVLLGVDVVMDATLQLVRKDGDPLLEILGIKSVGE